MAYFLLPIKQPQPLRRRFVCRLDTGHSNQFFTCPIDTDATRLFPSSLMAFSVSVVSPEGFSAAKLHAVVRDVLYTKQEKPRQ